MLEDVLKFVPLDAIVLETDAPYLPPVPYRGKRNEPAYLNYIAIKLAEIYQVDKQVIIEKTTANARSIFKLA
jgi:TatD DNase family protein